MSDEDRVSNDDLDEAALEGRNSDADADDQDSSAEPETDDLDVEDSADDDQPEGDDLPDEPDDNAVRSKMGRKLADLENTVSVLRGEMKDLLTEAIKANQPEEQEPEEETLEFDEDEPLTAKDVLKILEHRERQRENTTSKYGNDYRDTIESLRKNYDGDVEEAIMKEFVDNHNLKHSDDGKSDARQNFQAAELAVFKRMAFGKDKPTKGAGSEDNADDLPTGGNMNDGSGKVKGRKINFKLDSVAKEFIQRTGMKDEDVADALDGDTPTYLGGR